MKKSTVAKKKLSLNKETLANLELVKGGAIVTTDGDTDGVPSGGPIICYFSDCNPCQEQLAVQR